MLKVSYCDRSVFVLRRALWVVLHAASTIGPSDSKLGRKYQENL